MRDIADILLFRADVSPFLVHLTRTLDDIDARTRLEQILHSCQLLPGSAEVSDARFGGNTLALQAEQRRRLFGAICLTETPLSEIHCLLEIGSRSVNLAPYGLVFLKDRLKGRRVAPVMYLNNNAADMDSVVYALFSLIHTSLAEAERLLPLIAVFGQKIRPPGAAARPPGLVDFTWEREWRHPACLGPLTFGFDDDVFCGLCPHDEIDQFEAAFPPLRFIDPCREMKWYATALIDCRQRLDLKHSVV